MRQKRNRSPAARRHEKRACEALWLHPARKRRSRRFLVTVAATTAGPDKGATAAETAAARNAAAQPGRKELKKSKIPQKPPLHDPN